VETVNSPRLCSVCGDKFSCSFKGIDYCNKHYLRMYFKGTTELNQYKTKNSYDIDGDVAYGKTTKGIPFIIDIEDLERCKEHTWCRDPRGYFVANINKKVVTIHRYILKIDTCGFSNVHVDHINGDRSDNRRVNLRKCSPVENSRNIRVKSNNTSGYPGVKITPNGRFVAKIMVNRKEVHVGTYNTIEEAIDARVLAEKEYFGEFSPTVSRNRKYNASIHKEYSDNPRIEMEVHEVDLL